MSAPSLMPIIASSETDTVEPASTSPGTSSTIKTHNHTEPSIPNIHWKTTDELGFPDGNKGQKATSLSTSLGTACILAEGCVAPRTATNLFNPKCPLDALHSECWHAVEKYENQSGTWNVPTSFSSNRQPSPGSNSAVYVEKQRE